jgi:hypothetical protein
MDLFSTNDAISLRLRRYINTYGVSQSKFAKKSGLHHNTISALYRGTYDHKMSFETLVKLEAAMETKPRATRKKKTKISDLGLSVAEFCQEKKMTPGEFALIGGISPHLIEDLISGKISGRFRSDDIPNRIKNVMLNLGDLPVRAAELEVVPVYASFWQKIWFKYIYPLFAGR